MEPVTYSWIGLSAAAPLIFLLCAWVLGVFHSFRKQWRSVDLFLLAIFVQELLTALQIFVYSLLSLTSPDTSVACGAFVWSLNSTRTLQAVTVTSLLVDRALTSQWPYKYRFSVRRHQIRYHLVVLAAMAALVGVAALLARPSDAPSIFTECTFLPHNLHVRLSLFLLSLLGIFLIISTVSVAVVQSSRGCSGGPDMSDISPITHGTATSSTTTSSLGGGRAPHTNSTASTTSSTTSGGRFGGGLLQRSTTDLIGPPLRPYHGGKMGKGPSRLALNRARHPSVDFRWAASLSVAFLCYGINHLPYMALIILGTFFPSYVPDWPLENISLWLSLIEALILPIALAIFDRTFASAILLSCSREGSQEHKFEDVTGPFRLHFPKESVVKSFPLTNGSLFSSLLNMNIENSGFNSPSNLHDRSEGGRSQKFSGGEIRGLVGGGLSPGSESAPFVGQLLYGTGGTSSLGSMGKRSNDPIYSDPLNKGSIGSSLKFTEEDHIYATLSETFGSLSSLSDDYLSDHHRCSSATTVANDDFEYHGPRIFTPSADLGYKNKPYQTNSAKRMTTFGTGPIVNPVHRIQLNGHIVQPNPNGPERVPVQTKISYPVIIPKEHRKNPAPRPPARLPPDTKKDAFPVCPLDSTDSSDSSAASSFRSLGSTDSSASGEAEYNHSRTSNIVVNDKFDCGFVNEAFERDTSEKKGYSPDNESESMEKSIKMSIDTLNKVLDEYGTDTMESSMSSQSSSPVNDGTLTKNHRSSSLSMNDLDRLNSKEICSEQGEEEMMFILPVKSESMLSLYKLYLAEDEPSGSKSLHYSVEVSKSESDLARLAPVESADSFACVSDPKVDNATAHTAHIKVKYPETQELYQKSKVRPSNSRIKRQNKIQRAKGVQNRTRPVVVQGSPNTAQKRPRAESFNHESVIRVSRPSSMKRSRHSSKIKNEFNVNQKIIKIGKQDSTKKESEKPVASRRNGIITIRDPSVLSVEELFKVLNRVTVSEKGSKKQKSNKIANASSNEDSNLTEYKKIFVSEYI